MRFPRPNTPPATSNPEAAALISAAVTKCAGCRDAWRLDLRRNGGRMHYRSGEPWVQCSAQEERQALREIANTRKARK
jgi:hypothetical protein